MFGRVTFIGKVVNKGIVVVQLLDVILPLTIEVVTVEFVVFEASGVEVVGTIVEEVVGSVMLGGTAEKLVVCGDTVVVVGMRVEVVGVVVVVGTVVLVGVVVVTDVDVVSAARTLQTKSYF